MKRNHKTALAAVAVILVLGAAFWYGGGAPGLQGWSIKPVEQGQPSVSAPAGSNLADSSAESEPVTPPANISSGEETCPKLPEQPTDSPNSSPAAPVEPPPSQSEAPPKSQSAVCTVSISCAAVLDHLDWLNPEKTELIPTDGAVYAPTQLTLEEGDTAFSLLQRLAKEEGLHLEASFTPGTGSAYVEGIANLYEFDCGQRSGWLYKVNGTAPGYSSSQYELEDGDTLEWVYTCQLGEEVEG